MVDVLAAPRQAKADSALRTLTAISTAHWLSHFHLFVLPMLFPFLKQQLGVGYIELDFALTVFGVVSGLTQAPMGRAFSIHTFAGFLGGAVAPAIMAALVATVGGFGALIVAGAVGPAVALLLIAMSLPDARAASRKHGDDKPKPNILTPEI